MLRWLTRRDPAPPPATVPPTFEASAYLLNDCGGIFALMVRTVGVSQYQGAIREIVAAHQADYPGDKIGNAELIAAFYPEASNRHDPLAVQVQIEGRIVGYLSREDAREYRPVIVHLARRSKFAACKARIVGGRADAPNYGIWLDLASPADALE